MTIDDWRARYGHLAAEADRLRVENDRLRRDVERLRGLQERAQYRLAEFESELYAARADAERARWCEETKAQVSWSIMRKAWRVLWDSDTHGYRQASHADRNAAIDAAMRGGK